MRAGAGSAAGRESSARAPANEQIVGPPSIDEQILGGRIIDEHCRRRPAEPLRPYVAHYTGYRQRGEPGLAVRGSLTTEDRHTRRESDTS
jgi:hypothetical protein